MTNPILNWLRKRALKQLITPLKADLARITKLRETLAGRTVEELRNQLADVASAAAGAEPAAREALLPEVIALACEAAKRELGITPYDTQVMAAVGLYRGAVLEMGTGEGKTLTAPLAAAAHWFLHRRQVHVFTANEYLANRDAKSMFDLFKFLGLTVGVSRAGLTAAEKRLVYTCNVVYTTHQVAAQDFLRDHLGRSDADVVLPAQLGVAIVDEADAAFIDEARMPIVLSASQPVTEGLYETLARIASVLVRTGDADGEGDFWIDGKERIGVLTERGYENATMQMLRAGLLRAETELYDDDHQAMLLKLQFALSAAHLLFKDQHYVVKDDAIVLIDENTGRLVPGRRWDSGLQQALEAKEGVRLSPESVTLARITLQHFFKQYSHLSGMTGTAMDDADELAQVYGLPVIEIPPNKPSQRVDEPDLFYRTQAAKLNAVAADILAAHRKGQPVLIGTSSVEQSATLSARLTEMGLAHEVLNATQHEREADIIASAGVPGAITVSTNMAGRGVDIVLGGNKHSELFKVAQSLGLDNWNAYPDDVKRGFADAVVERIETQAAQARMAGGLRVIGLERYESRRIDRQLRGRCARQGDPGQTCFYLSLEDSLVENFAGERIRGIFAMLDVTPGEEFETALVKKAVDGAQREVEGRAQAARAQLMEFEGVLESQRQVIYALRTAFRTEPGIEQLLEKLTAEEGERLVQEHLPDEDYPETWNLKGLRASLKRLGIELSETDKELSDKEYDDLREQILLQMQVRRQLRLEQVEEQFRDQAQRTLALDVLDRQWFIHLSALESVRRGIHLRQHAKVDPRQAYAKEAFELFSELLDTLKQSQVRSALTWYPQEPTSVQEPLVEVGEQAPAELAET